MVEEPSVEDWAVGVTVAGFVLRADLAGAAVATVDRAAGAPFLILSLGAVATVLDLGLLSLFLLCIMVETLWE